MLEMSKEEQEERIKTRHQGSKQAVEMMRVGLAFKFGLKPHNGSSVNSVNLIFFLYLLGDLRILLRFFMTWWSLLRRMRQTQRR